MHILSKVAHGLLLRYIFPKVIMFSGIFNPPRFFYLHVRSTMYVLQSCPVGRNKNVLTHMYWLTIHSLHKHKAQFQLNRFTLSKNHSSYYDAVEDVPF